MSNSQGNRRPRFMSFRRKRRNDPPQEAPTKPEEDSTETFGAGETPPLWFLKYMPMFKKELIKDLLTALDNDFDEDEKRRRYKKGYFIMRSRLRAAERQLDPNSIERGGSESDTANEGGSPSYRAPSHSDNALNNEGEIRVTTRRAKRYNRKYTKKFPVIREDSLEIDDKSDKSKSSSQEDEEKDDNGNTNNETPIVPTINLSTSILNEDTLNANVDQVPKEPTPFMLEPKGFIVKPSKVKTIQVTADVEKDTFYHNENVFDEVPDNPLRLLMEYHGIDTELPDTYDECEEMIREIERTRGIPNILNRRLVENRKKRQELRINRKKLSTPPPLPRSPLNPQSVRIILNDATSSKMPLLNQLKTLIMETEMDEDVFITEFLIKAIDVGLASKQYVHLFTYFVVQRPSMLRMRKILLKKCEAKLDRHEHLYKLRTAMLQHVAEAPTDEIKQRLEAELMKLEKPGVFMGSTVLIGELYTHDLLSNKFFKRLIEHLLKYEEEDDLGYAAKLLKMCGKNFEFRGGDTSPYCVKLGELAKTRHLDIRVSHHIASLIEYKRTGWKVTPGHWATRNFDDAERRCESFCFSRVLDEAITNYGEHFLGKFTLDIQSHFNFFETGHFVRELINAAVERPEMHQDYFEIFKRSSSLSMWVGGEDNLSNVILKEMKYFSMYFLDLAKVMPEALECFYQFVSVIIGDWGNVITTIEFCTALSGLGSPEEAREWLIKAVQATGIQNNGNNYTLSSLDCGIPQVREKKNVEEETSEAKEAEE